jgi:hypothetical protein
MKVLQKAWNLLSGDVKASLQRAESNLNALSTVDLGPKRPFSVGEFALWAQLTGPQFAAQVAAAVSLVEAPANHRKASTVAKEVLAIMPGNRTGHSIKKFLEAPFAGKHPKHNTKGTKAAAAEAAVLTAAEAIAVMDSEEAKRLAAEFEAMGGGALTMALAQEAEPGDPLRECWLAHERLRVPEVRSINRAEILTARTDTAAEGGEISAAEAAAAEAAAAKEAVAAAEAAAAAGGAAKAAADALGARTALAPELPKEPGGSASGVAEDAEEIPRRPMFSVGAREELKTRGGSLSSEGANAAVQAERLTPINYLRSLQFTYALLLNEMAILNLSSEFIFMVNAIPHCTISKSSPVYRDLSRSPNSNFKMKLPLKVFKQAPFT